MLTVTKNNPQEYETKPHRCHVKLFNQPKNQY